MLTYIHTHIQTTKAYLYCKRTNELKGSGELKKSCEPRHEKTCLRGFRPGKAQTGLLRYRD